MSHRFRLLPCEQRRVQSSNCFLMVCLAIGLLKHRTGKPARTSKILRPSASLAYLDARGLPGCTSVGEAVSRPLTGLAGLLMGVPLDLNQASAADLQIIPGIGPNLSRRITEDRRARGSFPNIMALRRVRGIGPKLQKNAALLLRIGTKP